jgi:hypothetical protein
VSGGTNTFLSEHHDTLAYGVVKVKPRGWAAYRLAAVGGLGLARRRTERTGGTFQSSRPPFAVNPIATESLSDMVLAATAGVDGVFPMTRRVGILALARLHILADKDRGPDGVVRRGVSPFFMRCGIGAQVDFQNRRITMDRGSQRRTRPTFCCVAAR